MPVITLTTDFGNRDYRVALIKGSLLSGDESVIISEITHDIRAYDIEQAAFMLRKSYRAFPKGSVHMVAVDCLFHPQQKNLIYKVNEHYFLTADNGFISLLHPEFELEEVYEITYNNRFDDVVEFTPRDIFVPAALHLIKGGIPEIVGRKFTAPVRLSTLNAAYKDKFIAGQVVHVDGFGNVCSNISREKFEEYQRVYPKFLIRFRNHTMKKIHHSYADFIPDWYKEKDFHGKPMAQFSEDGFLEILMYKGSSQNGASSLLGLKEGEHINIEFIEEK